MPITCTTHLELLDFAHAIHVPLVEFRKARLAGVGGIVDMVGSLVVVDIDTIETVLLLQILGH